MGPVLLMCIMAVVVSTTNSKFVQDLEPDTSHRILMLAPAAMPSHTIAFMEIATALADHGHQITVAVPRKFGRPNMREIVLPVKTIELPNAFEGRLATSKLLKQWIPGCLEVLGSQEIQDLKKEKFDLIIILSVLSECFMSMIYDMQIPFVSTSPLTLVTSGGFWLAGNPIFLSISPGFTTGAIPGENGLSFMDKLGNMATEGMAAAVVKYVYWSMDSECRKQGLCAPEMPHISDLLLNNSLFIVNGIRTMEIVSQPIVPTVIYAGGIHLKEPEPLPQDLEEWASGSDETGFIFFSMGSVVKPSNMPIEYKEALIAAFAELPQRVLWKWDEESIVNLTDNVRLTKWAPQKDILGHPKLQLFMTHGGFHSTLEALYNGVPVLGVPLFSDQYMNMGDVVAKGAGLTMDWNNFTVVSLLEKITDIISNPSFKENAVQQSALLRDQLISPEENINYWVDYVIRHRGAPHLKCPSTYMFVYELYNMDVWLVLVLITVLLLYIQYKTAKYAWEYSCAPRTRKNKTE